MPWHTKTAHEQNNAKKALKRAEALASNTKNETSVITNNAAKQKNRAKRPYLISLSI
jgi:hypothetical protein